MRERIPLLARGALCVALALVLSFVESLFPLPVPVPGVKLGLANLVVLLLLALGQRRLAALVGFCRVCLAALLFSGFSGFVYALCGAVVSYVLMLFGCRIPAFSLVGVSVLGGVGHTMAQLAVAVAVTGTASLWLYAPILAISGAVCGALTGFAGNCLLPILKRANFFPVQAGKTPSDGES